MSNKTQLSIIAVFLLVISFGAFWYFNQSAFKPTPAKPLNPVVSLEQVNTTSSTEKVAEPDTKLTLGTKPRGDIALSKDAEFTVSGGSSTSSIRFFQGSIKPLDVHVGDTQNFRIVVASDNSIKRVVAEIETDFGYVYLYLSIKSRIETSILPSDGVSHSLVYLYLSIKSRIETETGDYII